MTALQVLGVVTSVVAGVVAFSPILQIRAMVKAGSAKGVSIGWPVAVALECVLTGTYTLFLHAYLLAVPYLCGGVLTVVTVAVAMYYRRREGRGPRE
jgi:hypothetical protein